MSIAAADIDTKREMFIRYLFEGYEGFMCVAKLDNKGTFEEQFFKFPEALSPMLNYVARYSQSCDVYFCPHLFREPRRSKETVSVTSSAWADLDHCPPSKLLVAPTIVVESSPGRFQALWVFAETVEPADAESLSRRIAYHHASDGCDKSGWDLTQLLRVPFTLNHKYGSALKQPPTVKVASTIPKKYVVTDFDDYPETEGYAYEKIPFPELSGRTAEDILEKNKQRLHPNTWHLYGKVPESDWSKNLWQLQMLLFEGGLDREEVYVVAEASACNKYARDGRSNKLLWKEVCRAWAKYTENQTGIVPSETRVGSILTEEERKWCESQTNIITEYTEWAKGQGDAAWQYHEAGAFIVLSTLLSGSVKLPTSFGTVVPNMWFMILADTTLTRKTTAMDMAMDLLMEVDPDCILATDGSIEGLFTSLSMRPGRPSVFLRDEFSGLLEAITKKDYYAGMAETLTKLYDGKFQKRVLRKEVIEVRDPVLILFAGGIRTRILQLLTGEHVASGFLPRFVFIAAQSDMSRLRPLGPPTEKSLGQRGYLLSRFQHIHSHYKSAAQTINVNGKAITTEKTWAAKLTPAAWDRYNKFEADMMNTALGSMQSDIMTPSFDRLSKSGLKAAILLAAARTTDEVVVEESDLVMAFSYVERWREHTLDVITNIGKTAGEKQLETIFNAIHRKPGSLRSHIMQTYHLTARDADSILGTLEQRGMITRVRSGRTERLFPIEGGPQ